MCCLCHRPYVVIHHIIPRGEGGPDSEENAAPLCPDCHEKFGSNPNRQKYIKQARDNWYEICEKRYSSSPDRLNEIANQINRAVTKKDLNNAVNKIAGLLRDIVENPNISPVEATNELSDVTAIMSQTIINKNSCFRCGYTWKSKSKRSPMTCPKCKSPYWNRPRR